MKRRWAATAALLLCIGFPALWVFSMHRHAEGDSDRSRTHGSGMIDFGGLYYGALCVMHHQDPYDPNAALRESRVEGALFAADPAAARIARTVISIAVNLPTSLFLAVPFALLPWGLAQSLWMILISSLLFLAACLMWDLGASASPGLYVCLAGFILVNCEMILAVGNSAGVAVGLCLLATWSFLLDRYVPVGVLLLAVSLAIKPHDAGFIWLFFLLAGGNLRKRALQTLGVASVLAICAAVWIAPVSPHWIQELHRNLALVSTSGSTSDPYHSGVGMASVINLQGALSILWNRPEFYNAISYLVGGVSILVWAVAVFLHKRRSRESAILALASISALSLLPVYHRTHDAKLLLLAIPACAMLWRERRPKRWLALALTAAGILLTSDIPDEILLLCGQRLHIPLTTFGEKMATLLIFRPVPLVLLALGWFYLWAYLRGTTKQDDMERFEEAGKGLAPVPSANAQTV